MRQTKPFAIFSVLLAMGFGCFTDSCENTDTDTLSDAVTELECPGTHYVARLRKVVGSEEDFGSRCPIEGGDYSCTQLVESFDNLTTIKLTENRCSYTCLFSYEGEYGGENDVKVATIDEKMLESAIEQAAGGKLFQFAKDCKVVRTQAELDDDGIIESLRDAYSLVVSTPPVTADNNVFVAIVDDLGEVTDPSGSARGVFSSFHGEAMGEIVNTQFTGPSSHIIPFLAMPHTPFDPKLLNQSPYDLQLTGDTDACINSVSCGSYGYISDLAVALDRLIKSEFYNDSDNKIIVNMSLGWQTEGCDGGEEFPSLTCDKTQSFVPFLTGEMIPPEIKSRHGQNVAELVILEQLYHIQCRENTAIVAAAGNRDHAEDNGVLSPGAWMSLPRLSPKQCWCLFPDTGEPNDCSDIIMSNESDTRPLLYAVSATDENGDILANARPEAISPYAAIGQYAYQSVHSSTSAFLRGSSVAAALVSGKLANRWRDTSSSNMPADDLLADLYSTEGTTIAAQSTLSPPQLTMTPTPKSIGQYTNSAAISSSYAMVNATGPANVRAQSPVKSATVDGAYLVNPQPGQLKCVICKLRAKGLRSGQPSAELLLSFDPTDLFSAEISAVYATSVYVHTCASSGCRLVQIPLDGEVPLDATARNLEITSPHLANVRSAAIELNMEYSVQTASGMPTIKRVSILEPIHVEM